MSNYLMHERQQAWLQYRDDRDWAALQSRLAEIARKEQEGSK